MESPWVFAFGRQFDAGIESLARAVRACPLDLWGDRSQHVEFWYTVYHTLFWLDLYLSGAVEGFAPPPPFNLDELDPRGLFPDRVYTQEEMLTYLAHCRAKCRSVFASLTDDGARRTCTFTWGALSFAELLLYNLRHVQDHVGELNLLLGQATGSAPGWVSGMDGQPNP